MESNKTAQLDDLKYIELIRKNLWSGQEFGRAAVIVGCGFSRNADKISDGVPPFPLWTDLWEIFFQSLYPKSTLSDDDYEKLREKIKREKKIEELAHDYEKEFHRMALDDFLLQAIPDNKYNPGYLHTILLSLPWSDVFTTNYDTLLERTLPKIYDRKYDIVLTKEDIPQNRLKPRIVKLHGSFPSHRPFIITDRDYKNYPNKFAPFTNMVQQAAMENIFCLIGFSGEDPNFINWSEWVQNNLKESTPLMYLCGVLDLSPKEKKKLKSKHIIPIDLATRFPKENWPDPDIRHKFALEWLLLTLMQGAPPNKNRWPEQSKKTYWKPSSSLIPPIPPGPLSLPNLGRIEPQNKILTHQEIKDINSKWQQQRDEYPGWIVAPQENKEILWYYTKNWIHPILKTLEKLSPPEDIFILCELNWRLQLAVPLFGNWLQYFEKIVKSYNPFPAIIEMKESVVRPEIEQYQNLDWKTISQYWVELVFSLAQEARYDYQDENYRKWMCLLENVVKQNDDWQLKWYLEESQYYLNILDQENLRKTLLLWPKTITSPFYDVKKAAILTELGELDEATKITEKVSK